MTSPGLGSGVSCLIDQMGPDCSVDDSQPRPMISGQLVNGKPNAYEKRLTHWVIGDWGRSSSTGRVAFCTIRQAPQLDLPRRCSFPRAWFPVARNEALSGHCEVIFRDEFRQLL